MAVQPVYTQCMHIHCGTGMLISGRAHEISLGYSKSPSLQVAQRPQWNIPLSHLLSGQKLYFRAGLQPPTFVTFLKAYLSTRFIIALSCIPAPTS